MGRSCHAIDRHTIDDMSTSACLDGNEAAGEERLLEDFSFRVRNLKQGPDGLLYVLTENGGLHRLGPAPIP